MPFQDIMRGMEFAAADRYCLLGQSVVGRAAGWPMGGPMSEPTTLVDLGEPIYHAYTEAGGAADAGWAHPGAPLRQLVQGVQHVGDALMFSLALLSFVRVPGAHPALARRRRGYPRGVWLLRTVATGSSPCPGWQ